MSRAGDQPPASVAAGDVVHIDEGDYMYGTGPLVLRVTAVGEPQQVNGERWLHLRGHQRFHTGVDTPERFALVRADAIRIQGRAEPGTP